MESQRCFSLNNSQKHYKADPISSNDHGIVDMCVEVCKDNTQSCVHTYYSRNVEKNFGKFIRIVVYKLLRSSI